MEEDSKGSVSLPGQRESELLGEKKTEGGFPSVLVVKNPPTMQET